MAPVISNANRLKTLWVALVAGSLALSGLARANDLLKLYELARNHDATLMATRYSRDAASEQRPLAIAQLLPQLHVSASLDRERVGSENSSPVANLGQPTRPDGGAAAGCTAALPGSLQRCIGNQHAVTLILSQTLWSMQSWERLKEADFQVAGADASLQSAGESLLLRIAQAYFAILSARDQLATYRNERDAFATLLRQAKVRAHTGIGPRSDVQQAEAYYDLTEQPVIDAGNTLDDAVLAMREIAGPYSRSLTDLAPLRADIPLAAPDPPSADAWVMFARENNPAARAAELAAKAAGREVLVQRGAMMPTLSLFGTSSRLWQNPAINGNQTLDEVGVEVNWPLFQGGGALSAERQANALYRQSESQYTGVIRDIEARTRAAYRDVVNGIRDISAAKQALDSARTAVEASRRAIEFGTGSEFELLQFEDNFYVAQRAYNQARYDYLTNLLLLKQQAGELTERDLTKVDDLLVERTP
jgi:outer membrane protein